MFESKEAFAQSFKAKNPDYRDVPDTILADKLLAKYPQYESSISTTPEKEGLMGGLKDAVTGVAKNFIPGGKGVDVLKSLPGAIAGAADLGERGIKAVGRAVTPKHLEEKFGFAKDLDSEGKEVTAAQKLVEGGEEFDLGRMASGMSQGLKDIPQGLAQGFQEGVEGVGTRKGVIDEMPSDTFGQKLAKLGVQIGNIPLSGAEMAIDTLGGGIAPVIAPVVEEGFQALSPEAQQETMDIVNKIEEKFVMLPPAAQEAIKASGILAELIPGVKAGKVTIAGGKNLASTMRSEAAELVKSLQKLPNISDDVMENIAVKMDSLVNRKSNALDPDGNPLNLETEEGLAMQRQSIAQDLSDAYYDTLEPAIQRDLLGQDDLKKLYMEKFVEGWVDYKKPSILEV